MRCQPRGLFVASALLGVALAMSVFSTARADDQLARGEYLAKIMDCGGCHTPGALMGQPDFTKALSGSDVGFYLPGLGYFYPPNLTSDPETGLGDWSEEEIITAITTGVDDDDRILAPVMPYGAYSNLTPDDAAALAHYIKSLAPVVHEVPESFGEGESPTAPYLAPVIPE